MCIDIRIGTFLRLYLSRSLVVFINEKLSYTFFKTKIRFFKPFFSHKLKNWCFSYKTIGFYVFLINFLSIFSVFKPFYYVFSIFFKVLI